jgi:hypothetical protein
MARVGRRLRSLLLVGAVVAAVSPALAQERPTLERLETWACNAAEVDGQTYRPVFCDARCGYLDQLLFLGYLQTCQWIGVPSPVFGSGSDNSMLCQAGG